MKYQAYSSLPLGIENKNLALIDTRALAENYKTLRQKAASNGARTIAVVKADAYGHGIGLCVPALWRAGCDFFATSSLSEVAKETSACSPSAFRSRNTGAKVR